MGKKVFLSYAEEDADAAKRIADRLQGDGFDVYYWQDRKQRGKKFLEKIGQEIEKADKFIACLSDNFINSSYCQVEGENAMGWENDGENPRKDFIIVAKVGKIDSKKARLWRNYDWFDLTGRNKEEEIGNLIERAKGSTEALLPSKVWPPFQNREQELDDILNALRNIAGERFFLVLAGPQMGKTWFVQKVGADIQKELKEEWTIVTVDLREFSKDTINDPAFIVGRFFVSALGENVDGRNIKEIVKAISRSRSKWLCILDGEELLGEESAGVMRKMFSEIYKEVKNKIPEADFAFIVASRVYHDAWRGILPSPRFRSISLSHFTIDVIKKALIETAKIDGRDAFDDNWYNNVSLRLHKATEGLPALLTKYMQWIRDNAYVFNLEDLESRELFYELARTHVSQILSIEGLSLTRSDHTDLEDQRLVLEKALLGLSIYRVFSISFLDKIIDEDLASRMDALGWKREDLWRRLLDTSAIDNATPDIWKKTYLAIRRLLFRYKYDRNEHQVVAHRDAGRFYDGFWSQFTGTDKAIVLVEHLWHQVEQERLSRLDGAGDRLVEFAQNLFRSAIESNHHTKQELSEYLLKRIADDTELINALQEINPNLFEKIIQVGQS